MSQITSRISSPKPRDFLKGDEANIEDETMSDLLNFIEPTIVFRVQNALFGLPRSQVLKSGFFRGMMESPHLGDSKEGTTEHPIIFDERTGITKSDMKIFCASLDIRAFQVAPTFSITEWASAYRLAKMWEFEQLRDYIFKHLNASIADPFERIEFADALGFEQWVIPALAQLCNREAALTAAEGARLGFDRFAIVCRQREDRRTRHQVLEYENRLKQPVV
ncbi:hypothetical protein M407DRAFT_20476 [Tulasnella calospora MUT 4182]|uniref:BTB domain-containing protein n=1 Tax=Tulasnella calospora MUT 4182 TaxID=1051891 RepID=A0A0C3QRJ0_9AGAM|nr:hypothetical protein M407DRAFT_20476 [Tulasnella calospora MUT 4182]